MAGKYISIDEAAALLGVTKDELTSLREKQLVRGFSDRGTWKFRIDEIEAFHRSRQADSLPEMPAMSDIEAEYSPNKSSRSSGGFELKDDSDSDVQLSSDISGIADFGPKGSSNTSSSSGTSFVLADEDDTDEPPTSISKQSVPTPSDSDVRLIVSSDYESDQWPGADETDTDEQSISSNITANDSDVRFTNLGVSTEEKTVSVNLEDDSRIALTESDARWAGISDSDVRLSGIESNATPMDTLNFEMPESDVKLTESDVRLSSEADNTLVVEDSGITLSPVDMDDDDSSIRLEADDDDASVLSDISMPDSGITIGADSGISLELAADSGLSLEDDDDSLTLAGDGSGISLMPDSDVGLTLALDDDEQSGSNTLPMLNTMGDESDGETTSFDMPLMTDDVSGEFEDASDIVMFEDDDTSSEFAFDDHGSTDEVEATSDVFGADDDDLYSDELSGELDVSDEILSDDDILEADDASFDDEYASDGSVAELTPMGMRGGAVAATTQWSGLDITLVMVPTLLMGVCTFLMYDVIRSMWAYDQPYALSGMVLDTLRGMFPGG